MVSEPTSKGLLARGAAFLYIFKTNLHMTVGQGCSLFIRFPNRLPGDCGPGTQLVFYVSEPTYRGLLARVAACVYDLPNLPPKDCWTGVQPVYTVSKPISRGLFARGVACL